MDKTQENQSKTLKHVINVLVIANVILYTLAILTVIGGLTQKKKPVEPPTVKSIQSETPIIAYAVNPIESKTEDDILISKHKNNSSVNRDVTLSRGGDITVKPPSERELINGYVRNVCSKYNMDPYLIMSMIVSESNYNPKEKTGICLGLMQISTKWHGDRAKKLGVTDFYDPYGNILLGVDYLSELFNQYKDPKLVLMLYNMNHDDALRMYRNGQISTYAKTVLARADKFKKGE